MRRITVLLQRRKRPIRLQSYLIWYLIEEWKKMGFEVECIEGTSGRKHQTDLLIPHIDLTKTPGNYRRFINRYPHVLNRNMTDNSKRRISKDLVLQNSAYDGPVIVKTDANYGGIRENPDAGIIPQLSMKLHHLLRPGIIRRILPGQYPVYDHLSEVPRAVWKNRYLVVERFMPERKDDLYCIRICHFLGDIMLNNRICSPSKVIKGPDVVHVEPAEIPPALIRMREELGFDYGKFDYVVHDDSVHLLDANKTPGVVADTALNTRIAQKMAPGILKYI
jgi:hypothetical protein